ncbi:transketolase C-terminal domain-containing protein [Umezawaea tangerina]|uniref:Transketolase-like protein n=1 Tax=Umezawaea tangerina TaxID=84725 RepID=A0A2T0SVQ5_9PSEU|nr:transketolase C-terminal domain-containing protein [Umezawaea tangerina]PRY37501.1 transketolase-like protein [Umezawaea tangerina]
MKQHPACASRAEGALATAVLDHPRTPWWHPRTWDYPEIHLPGRRDRSTPPVAVPVDDVAIIAAGDLVAVAHGWVDGLAALGMAARLVGVPHARRLDTAAVAALVADRLPIIVVEDHPVIGGLGRAVAEAIAGTGRQVPLLRVGVPARRPYPVGTPGLPDSRTGIPGRPGLLAWIRSNTASHREEFVTP